MCDMRCAKQFQKGTNLVSILLFTVKIRNMNQCLLADSPYLNVFYVLKVAIKNMNFM